MTTQDAVETALLTYLSGALIGAYPTVQAVYSVESASNCYLKKIPFVLSTLHDHQVDVNGNRHDWQLLLQIATSTFPGAQASLAAVQLADRAMVDAVNAAINGAAGYAALRALGIYTAECKAMAYNQQTPQMINPHLFTCLTFA